MSASPSACYSTNTHHISSTVRVLVVCFPFKLLQALAHVNLLAHTRACRGWRDRTISRAQAPHTLEASLDINNYLALQATSGHTCKRTMDADTFAGSWSGASGGKATARLKVSKGSPTGYRSQVLACSQGRAGGGGLKSRKELVDSSSPSRVTNWVQVACLGEQQQTGAGEGGRNVCKRGQGKSK